MYQYEDKVFVVPIILFQYECTVAPIHLPICKYALNFAKSESRSLAPCLAHQCLSFSMTRTPLSPDTTTTTETRNYEGVLNMT